MKKIGFDARFYGLKSRGLGRYTTKLLESLEKLDQENHYVVFLNKDNFHLYLPKSPNFSKRLANIPWYSLAEQILFLRLLNKERFDLVHFPHFNVPFFYQRPFIVTIHDLILMNHPTREATRLSPFYYKFKEWGYKKVLNHAIQKSKKIITVSRFTKKDILAHFLVSNDKIKVIYEACESSLIKLKSGEERVARGGLVVNKKVINFPFIFYTGAAYPHKNLKKLLKAFRIIKRFREFSHLHLILAGGNDYFYKKLVSWTLKQKIEGVLFLDFVEKEEELMILYQQAEVFVFPSFYEGFGFPPLEAMSVGTPVAASFSASLPEILGDAACYFNPLDEKDMAKKIMILLSDKELRKKVIKAGMIRARLFDWRMTGKKTLNVYQKFLK